MAAADDAAPTSADSAHVPVAPEQEATVGASAAQEDDAQVGEGLFIERPAPARDPDTELRSAPAAAPATAPAPAPAPAAPAATSGGVPTAPAPAATVTPAMRIPARPTEVRGVQIERGATATSARGSVALARTGVDTADLTVVAGVLLALGALLVRAVRPRPSIL